jgi:hypothetical protein
VALTATINDTYTRYFSDVYQQGPVRALVERERGERFLMKILTLFLLLLSLSLSGTRNVYWYSCML